MTSSRKYVPLAIVLLTATAFSAIPMDVFAADQPQDTVSLMSNMDIFARQPIRINKMFLANETMNPPGGPYQNLSGTQIDVKMNFTFVMVVTDQDSFVPNTSYMSNLTIVAFANLEPDPSPFNVNDSRAHYTKRNYMFQLKANRTFGGGDVPSVWQINMTFPGAGYNEVNFYPSNSSKVNETDTLKNAAGEIVSGSDGINDSLEIRWAFSLGDQCRNTNASGPHILDNWEFYGVVGDTFGIENSSKPWSAIANQRFDVYMKSRIFGSGIVQGREVPGGGSFLLDGGPSVNHTLQFSCNNYAWFDVNATNLSTSPQWNSDTLNISPANIPIGSPNWTAIGSGFKKFTEMPHADNASGSVGIVGPGENPHVFAHWMCNGIPPGIPSGKYNSTVTFRIRIPP